LTQSPAELCPNCGNQVNKNDHFCSSCGKALFENQDQEKEILSFGPWGISVCFSRPGLFVLTQQNNTQITLTDRRIYGIASLQKKFVLKSPTERFFTVKTSILRSSRASTSSTKTLKGLKKFR